MRLLRSLSLCQNGGLKRFVFALLLVSLTACQKRRTFDFQKDLGVAVVKAAGACIDIANPSLTDGQPIQFVGANQPPATGQAVVSGKAVQSCTPGDGNQPGLFHYRFKIASGSLPNAVPAFALVNFKGALVRGDSGITADLNGDGHADTFRSCTSTEGVHLTVWAGKPLESRRLWHSYYYLGYDVDPTCTDADTKP
jgi:hypothetical protein